MGHFIPSSGKKIDRRFEIHEFGVDPGIFIFLLGITEDIVSALTKLPDFRDRGAPHGDCRMRRSQDRFHPGRKRAETRRASSDFRTIIDEFLASMSGPRPTSATYRMRSRFRMKFRD